MRLADFSRAVNNSKMDLWTIIEAVRTHLTSKCSDLMNIVNSNSSADNRPAAENKIRNMIERYLYDSNISLSGYTVEDLAHRLFNEVVGFSVLTQYIQDKENVVEEINVNAWNDIEVRFSDGSVKKIEHFECVEHGRQIISKLSKACDSNLNDAHPMIEGSLNNNTRVVSLSTPVLDDDVGVACSIRLLKPNLLSRDFFIKNGTITEQEMGFLELAIRSGVSIVFVGSTGSGKTTLMNYLLSTIPDNQRIFTIEHNARELSLVKTSEDGNIVNNVVHTQTRTHPKNEDMNISQEDLVIKALRFDPNVICVGEMRDSEAYAAQEASLTGHTVVTSLHADGIRATHHRIATLCLKRFQVDINVALMQAAMAFPIIVYVKKLPDNSRKVMQISECVVLEDASGMIREYNTIFEFVVVKSQIKNEKWEIVQSENRCKCPISYELMQKMIQNGASIEELNNLGFTFT